MTRKGFYVYVLENWVGDCCDIVRVFRYRESAESYLLEHEDEFYRPYVRKLWVSIF